ncbi:pyrroloquinoline quinone biosynthesis protein PqqE [Pseudomonas sp. RIT-PI-S]|uniref:pyrroloquinoline quinone biosynthesis protein PqqE n=1 Tax=Pseudomonas sp. RIT-PI-S TaxID=3035295 RepID=UPI0021DA991E|nr:pyrroloquinoline quinone biosynthesis protein PqqE [Pseudomonas sp. RIT-PI-S]
MQISSSLTTGLSAIQAASARFDNAAAQVAGVTNDSPSLTQSTGYQAQRLNAVDASQQTDLAALTVQMTQAALQVEAGAKVEKASDRALGTMIDTYA